MEVSTACGPTMARMLSIVAGGGDVRLGVSQFQLAGGFHEAELALLNLRGWIGGIVSSAPLGMGGRFPTVVCEAVVRASVVLEIHDLGPRVWMTSVLE